MQRLEREVATLRCGLATRELTGQATGLLAAWLHIGTDEAWEVMRALSNHTNVRARDVARLLVASVNGPVTDPDDRQMLGKIAGALNSERARHTVASARLPHAASPSSER
jgi:phage-related minor tail protein